jgi:hypothetical protein
MLNRMTSALVLLLIAVSLNAAAFPVNESVGEYRIGFEAGDDINAIGTLEAWGIPAKEWGDGATKVITDNFDIAKALVVLTGVEKENNSQDVFSAVGVWILNESIDTTYAETEIVKNFDDKYVRIYDKTIDGHKGIYCLRGDGPNDPDLHRIGYYWLDESEDGYASELVAIAIDKGPESAMMDLLNTVHIERLGFATISASLSRSSVDTVY